MPSRRLAIHPKQARIVAMTDRLSFFDLVRTRRSIRRYADQPVDRWRIEAALEAAAHAPSAHNRQPWRFAVITSPEAKERLASAMGERLRADRLADGDSPDVVDADVARSHARITSAPALVLACMTMADMNQSADARRSNAERSMAMQSVAAAIQNLLLAVHAQGLAACWMCAPLFAPDAARLALDLPADWEPQALITLGYPAELPKPKVVQPLTPRVMYR
jgi:coenzyme F420-0:L-glutamate ligase/coenzyme F420-1:gamma-L-glutamate ligase